ncbi:MAG: AAA family ATPase [Candidatus Riflebacteria bacterium]|nr:AAA family ATPase [Candidatus Riflebacteria bacterium]
MYISRTIEKKVNELTKEFKVLVVTGARQVGKSTMLKHCDPKRTYVSLGRPNIREFANSEPELFLQRYKTPVIIDEIQYAPILLDYIKEIVDNSKERGQYWLTGLLHRRQHNYICDSDNLDLSKQSVSLRQ